MASALDLVVHHIRALVSPARRTTDTDSQLLARWAADRDERAFAALVARHGALVWRVGRSVLHQPEDADDIFQATFLVLARKAAALQKHSSVAGWLYQTTHRLALKARTASVRRLRHEDRAGRKTVAQPLEEISIREAQTILGEELNRLPAVCREPLLLCHFEDATQDEAARRLGCSLNTLKRRLERARTILKQRLSRRGLSQGSALVLTVWSQSRAPAQLVHRTITAATQFAAGQAMTGEAVVLAEGVLRTLMLKKLAASVTLFLALGSLTLAAGFALAPQKTASVARNLLAPQVLEVPQVTQAKDPAPRLDANGDPLPPGAIQRIGSNRFRHNDAVTRVVYAPDGNAIASTSWDGYLNLWDASTGKLRWRFGLEKDDVRVDLGWIHDRALAFSGDGKKLAVLNDWEFAVLTSDTGKKLVRHELPKSKANYNAPCVAIAPDLGSFALGHFDATVRVYDANTGREQSRIVIGDEAPDQFPVALEFSADGDKIYVLAKNKLGIQVFDTTSAKRDQTLELAISFGNPSRLILSHKHHLLAAMDESKMVVWDLAAGKQRHSVGLGGRWRSGAFSPDDSLFAGDDHSPALLNTATGKIQQRFLSIPGIFSMAFAPDGNALATGNQDGCIILWDVKAYKALPASPEPKLVYHTLKPLPLSPEPKALYQVRFANNGKQILSIGDDADWWDVASAKLVRHVAHGPRWDGEYNPTVSPDAKLLAGRSRGNYLAIIDAVTGEHMRAVPENTNASRPYLPWKDGSKMLSAAFSPDGAKVFAAGGFDPRVIISDVATGMPLHELKSHTVFVNSLAVSPNGRWLASAASNRAAKGDYDIRLWETAGGRLIHRFTPRPGMAYAMVFSTDSSWLVSANVDPDRPNSGGVQVWDVATKKEVVAFKGDAGSVAISPDGRMLATGNLDTTLRLWEVATGKERRRIAGHETPVFSMDFSPDGRLLAAASKDAPVFVWDAYATQKLEAPDAKLTPDGREQLWRRLADTDAAVGFKAIWDLIARPSEAVTLLENEWKRLPHATSKEMCKWVEDLSSDQFVVRKTATAELERFTTGHEDLLRDALQQAASLEARQRLEKILGRFNSERVRRTRMLEVLEQLRTPQARQFLQALVEQTEDIAMAREAAAGLKRLDQLR